MKKFLKHYANIFNTFGILTPLVLTSLSFVILFAFERNDVFSTLLRGSLGWFITIAVIGVLCVAGLCVLFAFKHKESNAGFIDLVLLVLTVLSFAMIIVFIFNPGAGLIGVLKWTVFILVFLVCLAGSFIRSRFAK